MLRIIDGSIIGLVGVLYVVLEFIPSVERPENMRQDNDGLGYENATETI